MTQSGELGPTRPPLMIVVPRKLPGRFSRFRTKVMVAARFLAMPILTLIVGSIWLTIELGMAFALGVLGIRLGLVGVLRLVLSVSVKVLNDIRRVRRLRKCTETTSFKLSLTELRKLKLCSGSGRSALNRRHWREGQCQHCLETIGSVNDRVVDHILASVYLGCAPVECDPRLATIMRRRGKDQHSPPLPLATVESWNIRKGIPLSS